MYEELNKRIRAGLVSGYYDECFLPAYYLLVKALSGLRICRFILKDTYLP